MKILFLSRLYWPHGGGVEKHVEKLCEVLIKRGHQITLITEQYDPSLQLNEDHNGIHIYRIPYFALNSKQSVWTWMEQHSNLVESADVVHIHDVFWWYWPTRFLFLFKPVFITFHGYEGNNPPAFKAIVQRKLAEIFSHGSICIGSFMKKWYKANPTYISYGASDTPNAESPLPSSKEAIFWGRFDDDTGVETYIEACKNGKDVIDGLRLYGDGPLRTKIVNMKIKDVKILNWTREIFSKIKSARYAFVSRYLSILEAQAAGRLVVAVYNNSIKKDYLLCHPMSDNMIIVDKAHKIVDRLRKLSPAKEQQMIINARSWALSQTWNALADVYEQLWKK